MYNINVYTRFKWLISVFICGFLSITSVQAKNQKIWVLVDTEALELKVMAGESPIHVFRNISIGRNGAGLKKERGDDTTPLGRFRIGWINEDSRYHRFFGFTYPTFNNAKWALLKGVIDLNTYSSIIRAGLNNKIPPQNTPLGGQIGIHGIGNANPFIHRTLNWTHGCIALTNNQIDRLRRWVQKGTLVVVR